MIKLYIIKDAFGQTKSCAHGRTPFLIEKCARDFLSAPTDIYPKARAIYQGKIRF